jgi:hypothetical protein
MLRAAATLFLVLILTAGLGALLLHEADIAAPRWSREAPGISQTTVSEARITREGWLSPGRDRIWVRTRIGLKSPLEAVVLVDLEKKETLCLLRDGEPVVWLSDQEVLVVSEGSKQSLLKRLWRAFGGHFPMDHFTRFHRLHVETGALTPLGEIQSAISMTFCSVSPDHLHAVACWGPTQGREIDLASGAVSSPVGEKYFWSPCFISNDQYLFVGETAIQSRRLGMDRAERFSQPLLKEIRDAIKMKGAPSIEICGRIHGKVYVVDHVPDSHSDRLLSLDERTNLLLEVTRLEPSRSLPSFSEDALYVVYQGNPFDRTWDTVYFQEVLEGAQAQVLIEGVSGQVSPADPVFWKEDKILYVHRGTEIRSLSVNGGDPELHWPQALLP